LEDTSAVNSKEIAYFFVFLDTLPLNPNGKIDRHALPAMHTSDFGLSTNFVPPQNPTEEGRC
jgi:hypothetical protein